MHGLRADRGESFSRHLEPRPPAHSSRADRGESFALGHGPGIKHSRISFGETSSFIIPLSVFQIKGPGSPGTTVSDFSLVISYLLFHKRKWESGSELSAGRG